MVYYVYTKTKEVNRMRFYRVAESADFDRAEKEFSDLPTEAKDYIMFEGDTLKATHFLYENYSYSKQQAREVCNDYWSFLKAKSDFRKGKTVYTEY